MKLFISIASGAIALTLATSASAITVETTNFITTPTNQNSFEGLGDTDVFDGTSGHTEDGITVTYVGSPAIIWTTSQPAADGLYSWYPNGGSTGYTQITFGGAIDAVEFRAGSGFFDGPVTLYYDVLLAGVSQATGIAGAVPDFDDGFVYYGFSGGLFDEVRLQARTDGGADFDTGIFEGGAFDDIQLGDAAAVVPEPATWAIFAVGLGMAGSAFRRRAAIKA